MNADKYGIPMEGETPRAVRLVVEFRHPSDGGARRVHLVGDFNDWSTTETPMGLVDGQFTVSLALEPGRRYRYKFLVDGARWENDWNADAYEANGFGGDDSVLDLTEPEEI